MSFQSSHLTYMLILTLFSRRSPFLIFTTGGGGRWRQFRRRWRRLVLLGGRLGEQAFRQGGAQQTGRVRDLAAVDVGGLVVESDRVELLLARIAKGVGEQATLHP